MPFTIEADSDGRFFVRLAGEPEFMHGLWMAPAHREDNLDDGDWVVLTFAVWNANDRPAIATAIETVKKLQGRVNLGIRPFEVAEEFSTWSGERIANRNFIEIAQEENAGLNQITIGAVACRTPVWHLFRCGTVMHTHQGSLGMAELQSLIEQVFQ